MNVKQICQAALLKNGQHETLADDFLTNPQTKSAELCAAFWDNSRRSVLRMQPWTCAKLRMILDNTVWQAGQEITTGHIVNVVRLGVPEQYICLTPGTTGSAAPVWEKENPVSDGTVEWQFIQQMIRPIPNRNDTSFSSMYPVPANYLRMVDVQSSFGLQLDAVYENGILYCDAEKPVISYIYDSTDPQDWDPLLIQAIMLQLASELAYPLTGSHENAMAFAQASQAMIHEGFRQTRRENRQGPKPADPWTQGLFPERKR